MRFEFVTSRNFNLVEALAEKIGIKANNNRIEFTAERGKGFIKMLELGPGFQMVLNRFCLKESLQLSANLWQGAEAW